MRGAVATQHPPWSPAAIAGLVAWYEGESFTTGGGGVWLPMPGSPGGNLTPPGYGAVPYPSTIGGGPAVQFRGATDSVMRGSALGGGDGRLPRPFTILAAVEGMGNTAKPRWAHIDGWGRDLACQGAPRFEVNAGASPGGPSADSAYHALAFILHADNTQSIYRDGVFVSRTADGGGSWGGNLMLGGYTGDQSLNCAGRMGAFLMALGEMSPADLASWWAYADTKWGAWSPGKMTWLAQFDASDAGSITQAGGLVSQWSDRSGNARNLLQATGPNQPAYIAADGVLNNAPALSFVDAGDHMQTGAIVRAQPLSFVYVGTVATVASVAVSGRSAADGNQAPGTSRQATQWSMYAGASTYFGASNGSPHVLVSVYNGANSRGVLDGTSTYPLNPSTTGMTALTLASYTGAQDYNIGGHCGFVGLYSGDITLDPQWWNLLTYLQTKWGTPPWTPASLPGLSAWYDASHAPSITAVGGTVTQWNDRAGSGKFLALTASPNGPKTGVHTIGGKNALWFDSTGSPVQAMDGVANGYAGFTQPFTAFVVVDHLSGNARIFDSSSGARSLLDASAGSVAMYSNAGPIAAPLSVPSGPFCLMTVFNGAASKAQIDSVLATALNPGTDGFGTPKIGQDGGNGVNGAFDLAEISFCAGDQSGQFPAFLAYARAKWGVDAAWSPTRLPGLAGWWDASDTATITASGGLVSQWNDKSGNGRHLTQGTGSAQPSTGGTVNGRNALQCVAAGGAKTMAVTGLSVVSPHGFTVVQVWAPQTVTAYAIGSVTGFAGYLPYTDDARTFQSYNTPGHNSQTAVIDLGRIPASAEAQMWSFLVRDTTARARLRNAHGENMTGSDVYIFPSPWTGTAIGVGADGLGGRAYTGYLCESVICSTAISDAELAQLETYLCNKWGIP